MQTQSSQPSGRPQFRDFAPQFLGQGQRSAIAFLRLVALRTQGDQGIPFLGPQIRRAEQVRRAGEGVDTPMGRTALKRGGSMKT